MHDVGNTKANASLVSEEKSTVSMIVIGPRYLKTVPISQYSIVFTWDDFVKYVIRDDLIMRLVKVFLSE